MNFRSLYPRAALGAAVGLISTAAYRSIQHVSLTRATVRQECWTWHWLPFHAAWIWPYLSMFLLVALPWFLLPSLAQVRRFAVCLVATAAVGWITFIVHPTACARPAPDGQPAYYALLITLDGPNNCLPCLHAAFSVLAAWSLLQATSAFRTFASAVLLAFWLFTICVSIIALRQHTDVDTLAGFGLGCLASALFQRKPLPAPV